MTGGDDLIFLWQQLDDFCAGLTSRQKFNTQFVFSSRDSISAALHETLHHRVPSRRIAVLDAANRRHVGGAAMRPYMGVLQCKWKSHQMVKQFDSISRSLLCLPADSEGVHVEFEHFEFFI
jgi:hypothetical protein